jgi:COMPASS component SWD3
VDKLIAKGSFQQQKSFQYAAYREQFLELIEAQEYQKAFTHLTKRLKPLEGWATSLGDFKDLCYLLTCRSVHEVLPKWQGATAAREALLAQFATMLDLDDRRQEGEVALPATRLVALLEQAAAYQVTKTTVGPARLEARATHATGAPAVAASSSAAAPGAPAAPAPGVPAPVVGRRQVTSLIRDFEPPCVPNAPHAVLSGHTAGLKSVCWLGEWDTLLSGGNDHDVRVWSAADGSCVRKLEGHKARIWQLASGRTSSLAASASADGTVKLWRCPPARAHAAVEGADELDGWRGLGAGHVGQTETVAPQATLSGHEGDVYSVCFHPNDDALVSCGYDKSVRLHDVATATELRSLVGHELPVREAVFNATGNLVVSGGKDATIRFWDVRSALCVRKLGHSLGEVTSVQLSACGSQLLSSSKDNSIRLWDVRAVRPLRAFKGHQNTSKNFVRARFGPGRDSVISGSEDGYVCLWSLSTGELVHRLWGHRDVAYDVAWSTSVGLLASCSHDGLIRTWRHDPSQPLMPADAHENLW